MLYPTVKIEIKTCEPQHVAFVNDLQIDSNGFDSKGFRSWLSAAKALPNTRFIGLGDWADLIPPSDKRYSVRGGAHRDDNLVKYIVDELRNHLGDTKFDIICLGNHCDKYSPLLDLAEVFCEEFEAQHGWYCGLLEYQVKVKGKNTDKIRYRYSILYHHGAWGCGGASAAIAPAAKRWAAAYEGWDVFAYGHNHKTGMEVGVRRSRTPGGKRIDRETRTISCGTWRTSHITSKRPMYDEKAGYPLLPTAGAIIEWSLRVAEEGRRYVTTKVIA